jgi:hypothetical protein
MLLKSLHPFQMMIQTFITYGSPINEVDELLVVRLYFAGASSPLPQQLIILHHAIGYLDQSCLFPVTFGVCHYSSTAFLLLPS